MKDKFKMKIGRSLLTAEKQGKKYYMELANNSVGDVKEIYFSDIVTEEELKLHIRDLNDPKCLVNGSD